MMFASWKRWRRWSLPSKLTAIGAFLGLIGIILSIAFFVVHRCSKPGGSVEDLKTHESKPELEIELLLQIGGFEIRVLNSGNIIAKKVYIDVVSWQVGAPGLDVRDTYPIRDLIPNFDSTFEVELIKYYYEDRHRKHTSGYIVATCNNCDHPKAWAFFIPGQGTKERDKFNWVNPWPIVEFKYPENKPYFQCVNYPKGVCDEVISSVWDPRIADITSENKKEVKLNEQLSSTKKINEVSVNNSSSVWLKITARELDFQIINGVCGGKTIIPGGFVKGIISDPKLSVFVLIRIAKPKVYSVSKSMPPSMEYTDYDYWGINEATINANGDFECNICYHPYVYVENAPDYEYWELLAIATDEAEYINKKIIQQRCGISLSELPASKIWCSKSVIIMRPPEIGGYYINPNEKPKPRKYFCADSINQ